MQRLKALSKQDELLLLPLTETLSPVEIQTLHPIAGPLNRGVGHQTATLLPMDEEKETFASLRGKCFRCAKSDHIIPACSYPESVKCNLCGAVGHVTPACGRRQVTQMAQHIPSSSPSSPPASSSQQLAIAYDGGSNFHADGSSSAWPLPSSSSTVSSATCAGIFYTPSNQPKPEMLL